MSMKRTFLGMLIVGLPVTVMAGLDDYTLRRLPATLANEVVNPAGNIRHFVPTSVNDNGLLAGFRLTFVPDEDGGTTGVLGEVGYIYDLNSRTYIAKTITNISITYIGEQVYIGKRLTRNGSNRWQTLRCPLSGLVQNENGTWSNPGCEIIDNDLVDNYLPLDDFGNRSELYHTANVANIPFIGLSTSTPGGASFVYDLPDNNDPQPDGDEGTLYFEDGTQYHFVINDAPVSAIDDGAFALVNSGGGEQMYHAFSSPDSPSLPITLDLYDVDQTGFSLVSSYQSGMTDSSGYVASPVAVSRNGKVLSTAGLCYGFSACTTPDVSIDLWQAFADAGLVEVVNGLPDYANPPGAVSSYLSDDGVLAMMSCPAALNDLCVSAFVLDTKDATPLLESPFDYSEQKFGEVAVLDNLFPIKLGFGNLVSVPQRLHMSPNGKYIVAVTKLDDGRVARYSFIRK